ncbi:MAG: tRNA pseudouridine(13) synthase TruD [Myxococcota bacterium]|jgi:tRNA pseudouridine13 synthase|nr:tRNA pseudouridine(13) synthase TruD [Myxococcota bacterium]
MTPPRIKVRPEDFAVDEIPLYEPSGEGGHTFVRIEKRMRSTEQVVGDLARKLDVARRDVGYAGRKDRVAVTRQWLSVPDCDPERVQEVDLEDARVLEAVRHGHKLRTGHLKGNRFEIRVEGVGASEQEAAAREAERIAREGFPNRFGDQRFGRAGDNPERGRDVLLGKRRPRDRREARFLVSALQSEVFNRVLAERPLGLAEVEFGDVAMRHESSGLFHVEDVEVDSERARNFEISATGPIFGTKMKEPQGAPHAREVQVLEAMGVGPSSSIRPPRGIRLRGTRRSLRVRPEDFVFEREGDGIRLRFSLPPGSFATVLLEEIFGTIEVGSGENLDRDVMLEG